MGLPIWLREVTAGARATGAGESSVEILVYVQPGAKSTEVLGEHDGALKLRINAPPVEGKANAAVMAFLADRLGVGKSKIWLLSGETHRRKRLRVSGVTAEKVLQRLLDR